VDGEIHFPVQQELARGIMKRLGVTGLDGNIEAEVASGAPVRS